MMGWFYSRFAEETVDTPETDHRSPGTSDEDDFTQGNMDESLRDGSMNEFAKGEEEHDVGVESEPVTLDWFMELYNDYIEYLPYIVYVLLVMFFCHYIYVLFVRRNTEVPKKQEFSRESRKKRNESKGYHAVATEKAKEVADGRKLRDLEVKSKNQEKELEETKATLREEKEKNVTLEKNLARSKDEKNAEIKALSRKHEKEIMVASQKEKTSALTMAKQKQEIQKLEQETSELKKQLIEVTTAQKRTEIKSIQVVIKDNPDAAAKITELQCVIEGNIAANEKLQRELLERNDKIKGQKQELDDAIKQIQNLETASNEQKQEIGMLVQQCESLKQQKRNLNDALDKVNQEKRRLEDDCDTLKKQKRDLEIRNDKLNKDLNLEIEKRLATREWVRKHLPTVCTLPQSAKNDDRVTPVLEQFMSQLNAKLPHALDIETQRGEDIDVHHGNPIFLPCIAASRVGSDVKAALDKAKIGKGQVILIIFHHLATHNCKIHTPTERKLSDKTLLDRCVGIVDCVYWMGSMYDCEANIKAFQNITDLLRWNVHQDDLLTLRDLVDDNEK